MGGWLAGWVGGWVRASCHELGTSARSPELSTGHSIDGRVRICRYAAPGRKYQKELLNLLSIVLFRWQSVGFGAIFEAAAAAAVLAAACATVSCTLPTASHDQNLPRWRGRRAVARLSHCLCAKCNRSIVTTPGKKKQGWGFGVYSILFSNNQGSQDPKSSIFLGDLCTNQKA